MPLHPDIVAAYARHVIKSNFTFEIGTAPPRLYTRFRGLTADGRRGLILDGWYYKTRNVQMPGIDEKDSSAPTELSLTISNADNELSDLALDASLAGAAVTGPVRVCSNG